MKRINIELPALVFVLVLVAAAYANSLHNGFHFDDFHTVTDNPAVRSLANIPRFFTDATTFSVLPANRTYRPFVSTSLAVDYALGHGYVPFWFHIGTLMVFLLQLVAMFCLFRQILRVGSGEAASLAGWAAVAAVAWYGLHPAMAETVNYVIQRGDIYSTLGVVASLALFACRPGLRATGLYLLPFVFGILSKPPAIVLPALLFAYVAYFERPAADGKGVERTPWRYAAIAALPALVVGIAAMVLQSSLTPKSYTPAIISHLDYCITQPFVLLRYFGSFFLPLHLNVDTDFGAFDGLTAEAMVGFAFLAAVMAAIWMSARVRRLRPISFGLLWFLVASIPTSIYTLSEVENDHRMYMPFVGLVLAATWGLVLIVEQAAETRPAVRKVAVVLGVVALAAYGYGVHTRNKVWKDEETLWRDDVEKSPHNGRGLMDYALTQMAKGAYPAALEYFTRALLYTPNYPSLEINLGICYGAMGDATEAQQHFLRAIGLAPNDDQTHYYYGRWLAQTGHTMEALPELRAAVALNPSRLDPRDLLARTLAANGDVEAAIGVANETLAMAPDDVAARMLIAHPAAGSPADGLINLSLTRYQQGDFAGTVEAATQALRVNPRSEVAYNNLGAGHAGLGEWAAAVEAERQALAIKPDFQLAKNNLAAYAAHLSDKPALSSAETADSLLNQSMELNRTGNYQASIDAARRALKMRPEFAEAWNNIAAGEAALKHWDAAIAAADRAIQLKPDFQLAKNNRAWAESEKAKGSQ